MWQLCGYCGDDIKKEVIKIGKLIDISGQRFGKLRVLERAENNGRKVMWKCKCDCGNDCVVYSGYLRTGETRSCGCLAKEILANRNYKHGKSNTRLNRIWKDMIRRCKNPNRQAHKHYYDKGITVCEQWLNNFKSFYEWSLANGYSDNLTIDRINNDSNYEPNNCRWVDMKTQCNNRKTNFIINYNGNSHTLSEWSEITGIKAPTIRARIVVYEWDVEKALTTPTAKRVI